MRNVFSTFGSTGYKTEKPLPDPITAEAFRTVKEFIRIPFSEALPAR
jgi:hypothetical protein